MQRTKLTKAQRRRANDMMNPIYFSFNRQKKIREHTNQKKNTHILEIYKNHIRHIFCLCIRSANIGLEMTNFSDSIVRHTAGWNKSLLYLCNLIELNWRKNKFVLLASANVSQ